MVTPERAGMRQSAGFRGLVASLPIVTGYLPVAFSFGLAALQAGLPASTAMLISALVFAGGSQFVMVGLLSGGGGLLTVLPTVMLMNARHLLYGAPVAALLPTGQPRPPAPALAFGLTDEVFATAISQLPQVGPADRARWLIGLQLGAYAGWLAGTASGLAMGVQLVAQLPLLADMLAFVLPGLFLALMLGLGAGWLVPASCAVVVTCLLLPRLPGAVVVPLAMLAGAAAGACVQRKEGSGVVA